MTITLSYNKGYEAVDSETVSTILSHPEGKKIPSTSRSITTIFKRSEKSDVRIDSEAKLYASDLLNSTTIFWQTQLYRTLIIEKETEGFRSDNAFTPQDHRNSITVRSVGRRGKFLTASTGYISKNIPSPIFQKKSFVSNDETAIWRDVFPLSHSSRVIFSEDIEVDVDKLPRWKPHITIDLDRLEYDDE